MRYMPKLLAGAVAIAACLPAHAQIPTPRGNEPAKPPVKVAPTAPQTTRGGETFPELQQRLREARERGDMPGVVALAERQYKLFPREMKATADLGEAYLARGDAARAEPILRSAITQSTAVYTGAPGPVLGGIYANLGQIALDRGKAQEAIQYLQRAVDYAPTAARARYLLASAFAAAGDEERAGREIRGAFNIDASAARASDFVLLARAQRRGGSAAAAADTLGQATSHFPLNVSLRLEAATAYRAAKQPAEALYELLYAQAVVDPRMPEASAIASAIADLRAENDGHDSDPRLDLLFAYLDDAATGQHDEALPTLQELLSLETSDAMVPRLLLARCYRATGRMGEAERTLTDLLARDASYLPAIVELAELYFAEGRREAAMQQVTLARRMGPNSARLREVLEFWEK